MPLQAWLDLRHSPAIIRIKLVFLTKIIIKSKNKQWKKNSTSRCFFFLVSIKLVFYFFGFFYPLYFYFLAKRRKRRKKLFCHGTLEFLFIVICKIKIFPRLETIIFLLLAMMLKMFHYIKKFMRDGKEKREKMRGWVVPGKFC